MSEPTLVDWLEETIDRLPQEGSALDPVVLEGVLRTASSGGTGMLESVLGGAARNAVAMDQPLTDILAGLQQLKQTLWERLEEELDPDLAWGYILQIEQIFAAAGAIAVDNYCQALRDSHRAEQVEANRIHQQAEQKVLNYAARLARANRDLARLEQAKTDFISIAAHELKTPLSVVQGYVDMLDELQAHVLSEDNGQVQVALTGLLAGLERLGVIIDNLLDVSAIDTNSLALEIGPVAVGSLVRLVVERVAAEARPRNQHFSVSVEPDLPTATTDSKRLYQVLQQLLNNAVKYTPDGGRIEARVYLETSPQAETEYLKIEIADSGIGIAPEDRQQIFGKFYRVGETGLHSSGRIKFKGAGPGLGLSIARGIIETLGGQIWVDSPGNDEVNLPGSTFHIRLPLTMEDAAANDKPTDNPGKVRS